MPAGALGTASGVASAANPGAMGGVPFFNGTNWYREKIFADSYAVTAGGSQEFVHNITPGGFLRGVRLYMTSTGGSLGTGVVAADAPFSLLTSISLENIDGSPICYPMSGYSYYLVNKYCQPWLGDPTKKHNYSATINPNFMLFIKPDIRNTLGCLANTDARAQYRIRYTIGAGNPNLLSTTGSATFPTVTVTGYLETWSQPDGVDLHGNPISQLPPGLSAAHITRQQVVVLNNAGAANTFQIQNTGNEIRCFIFVVRDSLNARQDYLTDPLRWRLDNRQLHVSSPDETFYVMEDFYDGLGYGIDTRETGVYVWPRFINPSDDTGEAWLPTSNATYLICESATLGSGSNLPGTVQIITDEIIPLGPIPGELESI